MAELGEAVAQAAEEVAEGALEVAMVSRRFTGRDGTMLVGGLVIGAATAAFVTHRLIRRNLETKFSRIAEEEIDAMREHFRSRLSAREEKPDLGNLAEKTTELGYASPVAPKPNPEADPTAVEPSNIFKDHTKDPNEGWDYEAEKANRTDPKIPYVIHVDERDESGFDESTFTYYDTDDVICDEQDNIINAVDEIVGDHNLLRFGHGSSNSNIVYIRNVALGMEIELIRSPNSYGEEVHGFKHSDWSDEPPLRRKDFDDE